MGFFTKRSKEKICSETKKHRYNSEAQAVRAINNYDKLKRSYYCEHCDGFHNTSASITDVLEHGQLSLEEENRLLKIKVNEIVKRNDMLIEKSRNQKHALATANLKIKSMNAGFKPGDKC